MIYKRWYIRKRIGAKGYQAQSGGLYIFADSTSELKKLIDGRKPALLAPPI